MRLVLALAAVALAAASLPAAAQQKMKPGLWEMQTKMNNPEMDSAMAKMQEQMAAMPPEQRKQMEAMMAQRGVKMMPGSQGGMTMQICMTKEQVERDEVPSGQKSDCKHNVVSKTGSTMKITFSCPNPPSSGEGEVSWQPDGYSSRMTVKSMHQGKEQVTTVNSSGKWLGSDCGNVRPMTPPAK